MGELKGLNKLYDLLPLSIINHKSIKMKKIILLFTLFTSISYGQIGYWTAYNFNVMPGSEETVLNLFKQYFGTSSMFPKYGTAPEAMIS